MMTTLRKCFDFKSRISSTAAGSNPSIGVASTSSKAAAIKAVPKPI